MGYRVLCVMQDNQLGLVECARWCGVQDKSRGAGAAKGERIA